MNRINSAPFWRINGDKVTILHNRLIKFLEQYGYIKITLSPTKYILVKNRNNRLIETSLGEISNFVRGYLLNLDLPEVLEAFTKGVSSYISIAKLHLLHSEAMPNDRDSRDFSYFFYKNCYCKVTKKGVDVLDYETLPIVIWEKRVIKRDYLNQVDSKQGQFEKFIRNITNNDNKRFEALKTIIGYLLHRNRDRGETVAVILYDEMMILNNLANGGTGKSLLGKAIGVIRDIETFDGKDIKVGSFFKNQRLNFTTDVIIYDDLKKGINLESFYAMITSGIEVEKKRRDAFFIPFERSPKILITSNYPVKGPGGSSDKRRRHEFEIANYYNESFTPEEDFKNRFFDRFWADKEWSKFFTFMMNCVQEYLKHGLIEAKPINLGKTKVVNESSAHFFEYAETYIETNEWIDKRNFKKDFEELFPKVSKVSPHTFTKWLTKYVNEIGGKIEVKSTGGDYLFKVIKEEVTNV